MNRWSYILILNLLSLSAYSQSIDSLETVLHKTSATDRINILNELSYLYRNNNPARSKSSAKEALNLSKAEKYSKGEAKALKRLAIWHRYNGSMDSAFLYVWDAISIENRTNNPYGLATSYLQLANLYKRKGEYKFSLESIQQALETATPIDTAPKAYGDLMGKIWNQFGTNYKTLKDTVEAMNSYAKALNFARISGDSSNVGNVFLNMANVQAPKATTYEYELRTRALQYFRFDNNQRDEAKMLNNIGTWHYKNDSPFDSIFLYWNQALELRRSIGDSSGIAISLLNLGSVESDNNQTTLGEQHLSESYRIASKIKNPKYQIKAADGLSSIYEKTKRLQLAFQFKTIADSLNKINQEKVLEASIPSNQLLSKRLTAEKLQAEAETARAEAQTQTAETQKNRNFWIAASAISALLLLLLLLRSQIKKRRNTEQLRLKEKELHQQEIKQQLNQHELETIHTALESQETERQRIAADLHDRLGSQLSTIKLQLDGLEGKIDDLSEANASQFKHTGGLLDETIGEVRKISHNMASGVLMRFGLIPALQNLADNIEMTNRLQVETSLDDLPERLPNKVELSLYRIAQELVTNILKHANASRLTIGLVTRKDEISLMIEDNGDGFDTAATKDGMGLKNVASRALKLDGNVTIDAFPGRGTIVEVVIPYQTQTNQI